MQIQETSLRIQGNSSFKEQSLPNCMHELDKVILLHIPTNQFIVKLCWGVDELCTVARIFR